MLIDLNIITRLQSNRGVRLIFERSEEPARLQHCRNNQFPKHYVAEHVWERNRG